MQGGTVALAPSHWPNTESNHWFRHGAVLLSLLGSVAIAWLLSSLPVTVSAVLLAGTAGVLLCLRWPTSTLIALALIIPAGRLFTLPGIPANLTDLLALSVPIFWIGAGVARRSLSFRIPRAGIAMIVFVFALTVSLSGAESWGEGLPELLKWVEFVVVYFGAALLIPSRRWKLAVLGALLLAGMGEVATGAYQFVTQTGPEAFTLGRFMRAYGTFQQPNPYAGYLGYLAPVALALTLGAAAQWRRTRSRGALATTLLLGGASAALIAGIGMSWSRGAWLGLAAALGAVVALSIRGRRALFGAAAVALALWLAAGAPFIPAAVSQRLGELDPATAGVDLARVEITDENFSVLERVAHWQAALKMAGDRPLTGVGIGNYGVVYAKYAGPHFYDPLGHAHNVFLNFLAETGVAGLATFLTWWIAAAVAAVRAIRSRDPLLSALGAGVAGTLVYLTVHNMFDNMFVAHLQLQLALLLGCLVTPADDLHAG